MKILVLIISIIQLPVQLCAENSISELHPACDATFEGTLTVNSFYQSGLSGPEKSHALFIAKDPEVLAFLARHGVIEAQVINVRSHPLESGDTTGLRINNTLAVSLVRIEVARVAEGSQILPKATFELAVRMRPDPLPNGGRYYVDFR